MAAKRKSSSGTNGYVAWINSLPLLVKIILALPFFDWFFYGLYRIFAARTIVGIIIGILWMIIGWSILWIIDIIFILIDKKPTVLVGN